MLTEWVKYLKTLLGNPEADTSQDEIITALAEMCLGQIFALTGRTFVQGTYRDSFITPARLVYLTEFPILRVISVERGQGSYFEPTEYSVDKLQGRLVFDSLECRCLPHACADASYTVEYEANGALPPIWVSMATADAIRAALAQMEAGNTYGFNAKKVAVTDVGSVEFSTVGDSPTASLAGTLAAAIDTWVPVDFGATRSCCSPGQISEYLGEIVP